MAALSAGLVLFRRHGDGVQVLLVHPGGPFWARKDLGAWSIPKGEYTDGEDRLEVARREFAEELGSAVPDGPALELGEVRQRAGKRVTAWAVEGDLDTERTTSNQVEMEWPRNSGRRITFPEVDRAEWFALSEARRRILDGQRPLLDRLEAELNGEAGADGPGGATGGAGGDATAPGS
ncbi:MAG: NUDIX domain-containing protein [Microthrixaceae bacterium]